MRKTDIFTVARSCITHPIENTRILKEGLSLRRSALHPCRYIFSTHHKALTVFLGRILKTYSIITGRRFSEGCGHEIDWTAPVILDHHSEVNLGNVGDAFVLHVRRDPRDVLISSCFYHQKSEETWLHRSRHEFGGKSYQEHLRSLPTLDSKLIFEMDHASGETINDMLKWNYDHPATVELTYEEMIKKDSSEKFDAILIDRDLPRVERNLLVQLYRNFSLDGPWVSRRHVRNPRPEQWREYFTPSIAAAFDERFPGALSKLGYAG
ncbi:MAG: sulfotransferase domain-containing protein [Alphaproteobacteria bacterium]|nr:sulfotransferase domain-containing protein [Alphaproteobacteria bacterium]